MNWREWSIGDKIRFSWNEFDGKGSMIGVVEKKEKDHIIVFADDMHLWVDDSFQDMFERIS